MIAGRPCVLIADDDPVTLRYLGDAIGNCGCHVLAANAADAALRMLPEPPGSIDLLLLDRRMPGCDGVALLRALRIGGVMAPAIATSAELDPAITRSLREAGFAATLAKPASVAAVRALLARFIDVEGIVVPAEPVAESDTLLLDDAGALAAVGGDRAALQALRTLFAIELAKIVQRGADPPAIRPGAGAGDDLHRLRASCGICGALQLRDAAERLESALRHDPDRATDMTREFLRICGTTQAALASIH